MVVRRGAVRSAAAMGAAVSAVVVVAVAVPAFAEDDIPSQADAASAAEAARADLDEAMLAATSGTDGGDDLDAFLVEHPRVANRLARRVERWQANGSPSLQQRREQRDQFLAEHPDVRLQVDALRAKNEQLRADHPEWVALLASLENAAVADRRAQVQQFVEDNPETAAEVREHRREVRELRREIRRDIHQERRGADN